MTVGQTIRLPKSERVNEGGVVKHMGTGGRRVTALT